MKKTLYWLHRFEDAVLVALLLGMIILAGLDILARTLWSGGINWVPPLLRVMVLWLGLLGAMLATRSREHIAIDLINKMGGPRLKYALALVTSVFAAFVCLVIAYHSQRFVRFAYEFGDTGFAQLPAWPFQLVIPITFAVMALRFALHAIQDGQSLLGRGTAL